MQFSKTNLIIFNYLFIRLIKILILLPGKYTCYALNDNHMINASIEVGIMPCFEISPDELIEIIEMQSFLLNCVATGSPKPNIKWNYDGKVIDSNDERFIVFSNGSLMLNEARQEDSGTYSCIIGNSAGLKRKESQIIIKPMDSFSSFETNTEPAEGFFFSKAVSNNKNGFCFKYIYVCIPFRF